MKWLILMFMFLVAGLSQSSKLFAQEADLDISHGIITLEGDAWSWTLPEGEAIPPNQYYVQLTPTLAPPPAPVSQKATQKSAVQKNAVQKGATQKGSQSCRSGIFGGIRDRIAERRADRRVRRAQRLNSC